MFMLRFKTLSALRRLRSPLAISRKTLHRVQSIQKRASQFTDHIDWPSGCREFLPLRNSNQCRLRHFD